MTNHSHVPTQVLVECRKRLLEAKADLLNQLRGINQEFATRETGGDEIDQSSAVLQEHQLVSIQSRVRQRLYEIETALAKIQAGQYGLCEETDEPIEIERLLAIPWTRLSVEGAEIQEEQARRKTRRAPHF